MRADFSPKIHAKTKTHQGQYDIERKRKPIFPRFGVALVNTDVPEAALGADFPFDVSLNQQEKIGKAEDDQSEGLHVLSKGLAPRVA